MQNQNLVLDGTGKATVKASCPAEAFEFLATATFTFQYAVRADEAPILATAGANASGVPDSSRTGQPIGDAATAEVTVTTAQWKFIAETARFKAWAVGDVVGYLVGTAGATVTCRPRRTGGS